MKAIICKTFGPLEDLVLEETADPVPGKGEILVRVEAAGVNFPDGLLVQGLYQLKPPTPFIPGMEAAGVVEALGEGVTRFAPGDRVASRTMLGGFAEKVVVGETQAFALPDNMNGADACAMMVAFGTSHHALKQRANLLPGETLVVFGAAGATGIAAVQIGKIMGANVIAVASSEVKRKLALESGADEAIGYDNLKDDIKKLTGGKGADVVYDVVGGEAFDAATRVMARNGRLLVIGFAGGDIPKFPVNLALVKEYSVVGVFWGNFTMYQPEDYAANMKELIGWYADGKITPLIEGRYPLEEAADVLKRILDRGAIGKIVLLP